MNDETLNHGHGNHGVEFEREDLSSRGIFAFMLGLAIIGVVIYFIIIGMYRFLDNYERSQMTASSPLVKPEQAAEIRARRVTDEYVKNRFKDNGVPLLETDERGQLRDFVLNQEKELNSYGWVDEKAGIAHIPIERAMDLIAERGLPVRPQGGTEASAKPPVAKPVAKSR